MSGAGAMIVAAGRKPAAAGADGTAAVSVLGTLQDPCSPEVTLLRILYPTAAACGGRQRHMPLPRLAPAAAARVMPVRTAGRPGPGTFMQDPQSAGPSCTHLPPRRPGLRGGGPAPPGVRHARASGPRACRTYQPTGTAMI